MTRPAQRFSIGAWTGVIALLFLLIHPAAGQDLRSLTAEEAVQLGLQRNAMIRAAEAGADEADALFRQARAARRPSVTAQGSYTRLSNNIPAITFTQPGTDIEVTLAPVVLDRYYSEVGIEQPLFTGLRIHNQIRAASHQAEAAALDAEWQEADVAFQIKQAYWQLYEALGLQQAVAASLARVEAYVSDVQNRRDAGSALESDVLTAQTRRSEVQLEQIQRDNAVRVARLELNRLIGAPLDADVTLWGPEIPLPMTTPLDTFLTQAGARHPQIDALSEQVAALGAQVKASQGGWLPEIVATGRYAYSRPNQYFFLDQDAFRGNWEAGVAVRWNLWNGGQREAGTQEARARLQGAEARLAYARDEVAVAITSRYLDVQRAEASFEVIQQNVREAEEAYRVVQQQHQEGVALTSTMLEVEEALRLAQSRAAQAMAGQMIARAALAYTLGEVR
ncbi:MAG: TolC family protein [Rhodothermales bacterium]